MPICLTAGSNETPRFYLINQTLGGPLVHTLRVRAGILLLITQRILPEGLVLVGIAQCTLAYTN
jgi:hypothetical protein